MLYDPKWEKTIETKADPFSLEALIAWLETMPAQQPYDYFDTCGCVLHEYFTASGLRNLRVGGLTMDFGEARHHPLPEAFRLVARRSPYTFGAALTRAREALAARAT